MTLLELERVSKSDNRGGRERIVLREMSLKLDPGELVSVWGMRRSGRSTLLRVAAGVEPPDAGVVRFAGSDLAGRGEDLLGKGVGYCRKVFRPAEGRVVLDQVMSGLLSRGSSSSSAQSCARAALERAGVERCAAFRPLELDSGEAVRVAIARVLVFRPRLLVIDEPTKGVDLLDRDNILLLLRSLADDGIAVLASAVDATCLSGADRALSLGEGELRGSQEPELAPVFTLRRASA
jgi:predicted ABC-type transport system involved in lysophospholipase L1 biosynthesis ATPase subunit